MFGAFDISASALSAQRVRLDTIASNIANVDAADAGVARDGSHIPYRRLFTIFEPQRTDGGAGVRVKSIEQDPAPFVQKYEPSSRLADAKGFVNYPNVNLFVENVNALEATRAYESNVTAIETTKSMLNATLRVLG